MQRKELFTIGNLHTGDVYAVEAVKPFGSIEIHGPFNGENAANTYAHDLAKEDRNYDRIEVVILDLRISPDTKRIVRDENSQVGYSYAV